MRCWVFRFFGMNRSKRGNDPYIRVEDSNYRSGTENAGLHQTLRGTILDKYSCFRIASMPPLLPLSHFIGTGYVKNLLAPTASASVDANNFVTRLAPNALKILFAEASSSPSRIWKLCWYHTQENWEICVKFDTFHVFQTVHPNFCVNLTQDEYIRK